MPVDAGELGLGLLEIFSCDFALIQKAAEIPGLLFQPGELPVDAAQGVRSGGVRIMMHNITSKYEIVAVKEA